MSLCITSAFPRRHVLRGGMSLIVESQAPRLSRVTSRCEIDVRERVVGCGLVGGKDRYMVKKGCDNAQLVGYLVLVLVISFRWLMR